MSPEAEAIHAEILADLDERGLELSRADWVELLEEIIGSCTIRSEAAAGDEGEG